MVVLVLVDVRRHKWRGVKVMTPSKAIANGKQYEAEHQQQWQLFNELTQCYSMAAARPAATSTNHHHRAIDKKRDRARTEGEEGKERKLTQDMRRKRMGRR